MKKSLYIIMIVIFMLMLQRINAYEFKAGDMVEYNNIKFYVISNKEGVLTLLKARPLLKTDIDVNSITGMKKAEELNSYDFYKNTKYLYMPFYYCEECDYESVSINYNDSLAKKVVDYWTENNINESDLVADSTGYKARLLSIDDAINSLGYQQIEIHSQKSYIYTDDSMKLSSVNSTWTMSRIDDSTNIANFLNGYILRKEINDFDMIAPVINIKPNNVTLISKNSANYILQNQEYKVGDKIIYNGQEFYVLRDSSSSSDYVTLVKSEPLSYEEGYKYIDGYNGKPASSYIKNMNAILSELIVPNSDKKYASVSFCSKNNGQSADCEKNYDASPIKYVVDNWSKELFGDGNLVEDEYTYKSRIINKDDLINYLHYENGNTLIISSEFDVIQFTENSIDVKLYGCWTMSLVGDSSTSIFVQHENGNFNPSSTLISGTTSAAICPVVNVKKSVDNLDEMDNNSDEVNVPDTSLKITLFLLLIGIVVIIVSILLFIEHAKQKGLFKK